MQRRYLLTLSALTLATAAAGSALAQSYPNKVVKLQVPFAPGGTTDIVARVVAEPLGKAGAYAIQGRVAMFISHMSGSYSGIMGLPLYETAQLLREAGLPLP